jgi:hypothetical protein
MLRRTIAALSLLGLVACGSVEENKPDASGTGGQGGSSGGGAAGHGSAGSGPGGSIGGGGAAATGGSVGGVSGAAGAIAGASGTTGAAGAAGTAGAAGAAGTTGAGGRGGTTGVAGAAGTTGAAGAAGTTGVAGTGGAGGATRYAVSGSVQGAPAGTAVTATSTTTGATCSGSACQVPMGGSVVLTAPSVSNYYFQGWGGGTACQSTSASFTVSNVTGNVSCVAIYQITYLVVVSVTGATGTATTITPTSPTPGATCAAGSCRVPFGGTVAATAPAVTNWYFSGWSGSVTTTNTLATIASVIVDSTMVANYINSRQEPCRNQPPANGTTSSMPNVTTTYTTAGGWSTPALCPFTCATNYCSTGTACVDAYVDRISYTTGVASKWYGGDDRSGFGPRTVGTGQSVTPAAATTLDRFAFNFQGGFTSSTTGAFGTQPIMLALQVRNAAGTVLQNSTVTLPADFPGGWVYWTIPTTTLSGGTNYVFTSYMLNALTNGVNSGSLGDANAGFSAGDGYNATQTTRDPNVWTDWSTHPWDFQFRLQSRNPACSG